MPRTTKGPTEEEWLAKKPTIQNLYGSLSLTQLKDHMRINHQFIASLVVHFLRIQRQPC